ncbi:autotransporter outer membrane beta-barrel domain-containing protein [Ancylobacter sp. SL191]|uniref:autotransporter outer membrane beta-barrel domain-containing protein n=1 Tax=Ancylobacter sp. SL191 TaxID=2995166 RepID=UPI00226F8C92|nr:autotransporter domain-containing protein [Ancylobacter sp. SL191]WAC28080.1 autotransporter domain-containing protein [Ancylobacter sp. SL191]
MRAQTLMVAGLGVGALAPGAQAAPLPTVYQTLDFGSNGTFLTGIRGDNIVGNYTIPGSTETGGLYYNMTTQTWSAMPEATSNGANFPGAIGSSPYGPSFGNPGGVLRVVGSYQTSASAPYDLSYLYDGANAPGQQITTLVYPGSDTLFTIAHSTFGNRVVGNYDTRLATGNAFIYDIDTGTYTTNNIPGAVSTTAYGVYGDKIAGGYGEVLVDGVVHAEHGYIYDRTNGTYVTYDHPGAVATHFEGITGAGRSGEYNLVVNWVTADGVVHPAVLHVDALGNETWYEIDIPGNVVSSNSAYGDNVVGIYVDSTGIHGYLATIPGMYNPIRNTGTVASSIDNDAVLSGIIGDDIINSGTISVSGNGGVAIRGDTYGVLTNSGTVTASGIAGAAVEMHGAYGTLLNTGTLQTTAAADALRTGADAYGSVIVNTGIIDGRLAATAGDAKRFENSGWFGVSGDGVAITHLFRGTFVQTSVGTYAMRVTDSRTDAFEITGIARLAGTLSATFQTDQIAPSYTVLTATQEITGGFETLTTQGLPALYAASLASTTNLVTLNVAADLSGLGTTANQRAVGTALDGIINTPTGGLLTTLPEAFSPLYDLTAAELPGALAALSGEAYASEQTVLIGDSLYSRNALLGRLRQGAYAGTSGPTAALGFGGPALAYAAPASSTVPFPVKATPTPAPSYDMALWAQAFGGWSDYDGGSSNADVDASLGGFITGADVKVTDWILGAAVGYSQSSADTDALASSSDVDSVLVALYAGTTAGPWKLRLGASYAFNQIDASRTIAYPGYAAPASADYDGGTAQVFGEVGYGFGVGTLALEPFAGLAYVHLSTDAFTETGATAGLSADSTSTGVGYSSLGLRVATRLELTNGMVLEPHASLAWQYAFGDITPEAQMTFISAPGASFTVAGIPLAENTALVEIGADLRISEQFHLGASYVGQYADSVTVNALQASLTWKF